MKYIKQLIGALQEQLREEIEAEIQELQQLLE